MEIKDLRFKESKQAYKNNRDEQRSQYTNSRDFLPHKLGYSGKNILGEPYPDIREEQKKKTILHQANSRRKPV